MATEEPKIASTVSFRPDYGPRDAVIGDQKHGFVDQKVARDRGAVPALLPPYTEEAPPKTSLAERLRHRLEGGRL
jgi:hypothetical protein